MNHINDQFFGKSCLTIPNIFETNEEKDELTEKNSETFKKLDAVKDEKNSLPYIKLSFDYNNRLDEMWSTIGTKLIEKMSDSRKIMQEELKQIQERKR